MVLAGYIEQNATVQMMLTGQLKPRELTELSIYPISNEADWRALSKLVFANHRETAREENPLTEKTTRGMIESYWRKTPVCKFFIAAWSGEP